MSGGQITSLYSRTHMHAIRDKLTLLTVGGNTIRMDNPRLDARLVNGKAPDVLIFSHQDSFDKEAQVFSVPNRNVYIEPSWERFFNTPFGMVEAGPNLFSNLPKSIKYMLLYRSNSMKQGVGISQKDQWKMLWQGRNEDDSYGWFYRE